MVTCILHWANSHSILNGCWQGDPLLRILPVWFLFQAPTHSKENQPPQLPPQDILAQEGTSSKPSQREADLMV